MPSEEINDYYNQTQHHYDRWWNLKESMALHYGLWHKDTKSFKQALRNTNSYLANLADIQTGARILDAGCGVAGSAIFLASNYGACVNAITLSEKQILRGKENVINNNVAGKVKIQRMDYTQTEFDENTFDYVWACESFSSCSDKEKLADEVHRVLKPGGKLVLADFFRSDSASEDDALLARWCDSWAMAPLVSSNEMRSTFTSNNFIERQVIDLSPEVLPTVKYMYRAYLLGAIPSMLYNSVFNASKYSREHYLSGKHQYKAFKKGLWSYQAMVFEAN